jgi:hypothetical protein
MCDMYKSSLGHIHDPVLLSLKMEGIRFLCTGASPTHEFSSVLAPVVGCCYQIHARCIAMTELDTKLYLPVLCFKLNSRLACTYTCGYTTGFSGCLPNVAILKLSASHGPSCLCLYINTLAYEDTVSRVMWQDLKWILWERSNSIDSEIDCVGIALQHSAV